MCGESANQQQSDTCPWCNGILSQEKNGKTINAFRISEKRKKLKINSLTDDCNYKPKGGLSIQIGDECLFYSAVKEKAIKGIMKVAKEYYANHTDTKKIFGMVDVTDVKDLKEVYLSEIKADPVFDDVPLVKQARLSVMPVSLKQWNKLIKMCEKK